MSELCKPAVLFLAGAVLGSSVLGICLIHLSKSLRWISIRFQVPVITATFLKDEDKEGIGRTCILHHSHRLETIFLFKSMGKI